MSIKLPLRLTVGCTLLGVGVDEAKNIFRSDNELFNFKLR